MSVDVDAVRELTGHLCNLRLDSTAERLDSLCVEIVDEWSNLCLSDLASEVDPESVEELRSFFGDFPLPFTNPEEQSDVQRDRRIFAAGCVRSLTERLRSLRKELQVVEAEHRSSSSMEEPNLQNKGIKILTECTWLKRIVNCVHEDTRDPRKMQRYQYMIRDWAIGLVQCDRPTTISRRDELKRDNPNITDEEIEDEMRKFEVDPSDKTQRSVADAEYVLHDPYAITTHVGTPLNKKYATLALIHDDSQHCDFPIDPWANRYWGRPHDDPPCDTTSMEKKSSDEEWGIALKYCFLKKHVSNITDTDQTGLEKFLDDVSKDLEKHCNAVGTNDSGVDNTEDKKNISSLTNPIPVVEIVRAVGHAAGRSDKLAEKMKRRNYLLVKSSCKWFCQREDAIAMFPRYKKRIEEI